MASKRHRKVVERKIRRRRRRDELHVAKRLRVENRKAREIDEMKDGA